MRSTTPSPPPMLFGPEPPHTWCYYFQKADLARQRGDWDEVARLGDEARELGFAALDVSDERRIYYRITDIGRRVAMAEARRLELLTQAARIGGLLAKGAK